MLLISETIDQGSHTKLEAALRAVSNTNTAIYSLAFSTSKSELGREGTKFGDKHFSPPLPPGPKHGCLSRDLGIDADGRPIQPDESKATQNLKLHRRSVSPLRLAKLAEIGARDDLSRNISESVARLTGGESFKFKDSETLQKDMFTIANHIPNRYVLSFHPQQPVPGFHAITLSLRDYGHLSVEARNGYWVEDQDGAGGRR